MVLLSLSLHKGMSIVFSFSLVPRGRKIMTMNQSREVHNNMGECYENFDLLMGFVSLVTGRFCRPNTHLQT